MYTLTAVCFLSSAPREEGWAQILWGASEVQPGPPDAVPLPPVWHHGQRATSHPVLVLHRNHGGKQLMLRWRVQYQSINFAPIIIISVNSLSYTWTSVVLSVPVGFRTMGQVNPEEQSRKYLLFNGKGFLIDWKHAVSVHLKWTMSSVFGIPGNECRNCRDKTRTPKDQYK